jgi:hypothetical protein
MKNTSPWSFVLYIYPEGRCPVISRHVVDNGYTTRREENGISEETKGINLLQIKLAPFILDIGSFMNNMLFPKQCHGQKLIYTHEKTPTCRRVQCVFSSPQQQNQKFYQLLVKFNIMMQF